MAALDYYPKLIPGGVYHIFNHSNSEEKLFYKDANYFFEDPGLFRNVMYYIHHNASHHGYEVADIDYPFSSYQAFLSEKKTRLKREEVLLMFGGKEKFEFFHNQKQNLKSIEDFIIEEND